MIPTSHSFSGAKILGNAGFKAGPTDESLEKVNLSRERHYKEGYGVAQFIFYSWLPIFVVPFFPKAPRSTSQTSYN